MVIDLFRWPPRALPYQEVIASAVESFSGEGRRFDHSRSACSTVERTHRGASSFAKAAGGPGRSRSRIDRA